MTIRWMPVAAAAALGLALSGCATKPATLYQWQAYQAHLDQYFRADNQNLDAQVQSMETDLQKIRVSGGAVPPGYHAHLGLLYGKQGKPDQFMVQMQTEKKLFPESEIYVDFLLRNFRK
ncbi:MAG: DUF4810 domain-containing protein [Betaproteobacteria bacterium]|nr:DUF4810 domain-containing protein [Betaproteobacteria bacterium]